MRVQVLSAIFCCLLCTCASAALREEYTGPAPLTPVDGKVGIFDLKAIDSVPLDPEVVKREVVELPGYDGTKKRIVTEAVRFTGRPGVRVYMTLAYPEGVTHLPVHVCLQNEGVKMYTEAAFDGRLGVMVCSTSANGDPSLPLTTGGPPYDQFCTDDPEQSWFYHVAVGVRRAITYLESRPEADTHRLFVTGYSITGQALGLLHAVEERPKVFILWNATGFLLNKPGDTATYKYLKTVGYEEYLKYSPVPYAEYGSSPIFLQTAANDHLAFFDALLSAYPRFRCQKRLAIAPNRVHDETGRRELKYSSAWANYALNDGPPIWQVQDGAVRNVHGRLVYRFSFTAGAKPTYIDVYYARLLTRNWETCVWHRQPAKQVTEGVYEAEIPVVDPGSEIAIFAQIQGLLGNATVSVANTPAVFVPKASGVTRPYARCPKMLIDFEDRDDLYVWQAGSIRYVSDAPEGAYAAEVTPFPSTGMVQLFNFETPLWRNPKELVLYLKGDGKPGPLEVWLDFDQEFHSIFRYTLVTKDEVFSDQWQEYRIPIRGLPGLERFRFLAFNLQTRPGMTLGLDAVRWR